MVKTNTYSGVQCPNGGISIETFTDVNADGLYIGSVDDPHNNKVICHGEKGADGKSGINSVVFSEPLLPDPAVCPVGGIKISSFLDNDRSGQLSAGDSVLFASVICHGIKGETGAKGDTGAQGAKGDTGAKGDKGADVVVVNRPIPAGTAECGGAGGNIVSSWTDVVSTDRDAGGSPIFTASPVNGLVDLNLKEFSLCHGKDGKSVAINQIDATTCPSSVGGKDIVIVRDLNDDSVADVGEPELNRFTICNGGNGADGRSSIITSSILDAGSAECQNGGVKFDICLKVDNTAGCGANDLNRSSPVVCNGADSVVTVTDIPVAPPGASGVPGAGGCLNGGVTYVSFTDINGNGIYDAQIDRNMTSKDICY